MTRWWRFLQNGRNREVLGWLGGGAAVVAAALWAVFVHFDQPAEAPPAETRPNVEARDGSAAAGGDIIGSEIHTQGSAPQSRDGRAAEGGRDAPSAD